MATNKRFVAWLTTFHMETALITACTVSTTNMATLIIPQEELDVRNPAVLGELVC